MEVVLEQNSPTLASLKVTLTKDDYQPKIDKTIKDYSKKVNLKGFRPGKVPSHVIQRMYGKSILVDEVNNLLSTAVSSYIRENKLQVVGDPVPNRDKAAEVNWDSPSELEFSYDLGVATDFDVNFSELPAVKRYTINVDDAELSKTIESLRERFAENIHPEVSEEGDMIFGELKQESSEFTTRTAIPTKQLKPEALAKFIGVKKDDVITFDINDTFSDEAAIAHVTGKKKEDIGTLSGEFTLVVEDVTRSAASELNQDLFDKVLGVGQVENEEQFNEKLLEIIKGNYERETEALLRRDIENALLESINIELPGDFLKDWLERTNEGKFTREQIEEQFEDFKKSLKLSLIKNKVADRESVKVEYPEILEFTRNMVKGQFGIYGDDDNMKETIDRVAQGYLADKERDNYTNVFNQVFDNKVMDIIRSQVSTDEQTIEVSEFEKLAKGEEVAA
ncbi:trigger factor [Dyadobacter chenwenxiniae]|uniref:Trigger factor n=1 Tax=Dyadobacter chenwenxiniae TaxID=2906456 RepID=A0A9X1PJM8_9BACT|nr:trigger factor [Dyadobacter chenwenxiniae]MCF0052903.1 trigger factor [Dyadobacter chenwenxiniae]MCF0061384.1 trigger factor [Dyadobacter chenwenxiniae]UON81206.1 trigger factor [Dyadobacter chenwenxiniae]